MRKQVTFEELYDHFQARRDEHIIAEKIFRVLRNLDNPDDSDLLGLVDDFLLFHTAKIEYRVDHPFSRRENDLYLEALAEAEDRALGAIVEWFELNDPRFRFVSAYAIGSLFVELLDSDPAEVATA